MKMMLYLDFYKECHNDSKNKISSHATRKDDSLTATSSLELSLNLRMQQRAHTHVFTRAWIRRAFWSKATLVNGYFKD